MKNKLLLFAIFILAIFVRLYGLNWDQGQHLHPDERFLTMYINDTNTPTSFSNYLSSTSPLNPYNLDQYKFFVYGTLPTSLVSFISNIFNLKSYFYITIIGRILSASFDSLNIFTIYFFFKLILNNSKKSLLPSLIYAITVLPIQLSHYLAVDIFLNFFIFTSFTYLLYWYYTKKTVYLALSSLSFGLALSSKITAVLILPVLLTIFSLYIWKTRNFKKVMFSGTLFIFISFITVRICSPYYFSGLLTLNPQFLVSLQTLKSFNTEYFPPAVQWLSKTKFVFPLTNMIFWSLGIPVSIVFILSLKKTLTRLNIPIYLSFLWIVYQFVFQSSQFSYAQRYYLIIIPSISIVISFFLIKQPAIFIKTFLFFHFIYLMAFLNIYRLPHSRLQASRWIHQNIPKDSVLSCEHWDDCLPLSLPDTSSRFQTLTLNLYNQDTPEKWPEIYQNLSQIDYIVMSSSRLWGSIPKVPHIYPETSKFYEDLFSEVAIHHTNASFTKIAQFTNYPGFYLPFLKSCIYIGPSDYPGQNNKWLEVDTSCLYKGIYLRNDTADESFTVYDHPQVLIFKKND